MGNPVKKKAIFNFNDDYYYSDKDKTNHFRELVGFKTYNVILDILEDSLIKGCSPNDKIYMTQLSNFVDTITLNNIDDEFNLTKDFIRFYKYNLIAYMLKELHVNETFTHGQTTELTDEEAKFMAIHYVGGMNILPDNELFYIIPPDIIDQIANKYKKNLLH